MLTGKKKEMFSKHIQGKTTIEEDFILDTSPPISKLRHYFQIIFCRFTVFFVPMTASETVECMCLCASMKKASRGHSELS